jgi:hypothetical protein
VSSGELNGFLPLAEPTFNRQSRDPAQSPAATRHIEVISHIAEALAPKTRCDFFHNAHHGVELSRDDADSFKGFHLSIRAHLQFSAHRLGEIQWMRKNGFDVERRPVLKPLNNIECRDALLNPDGSEAVWPDAHVTIGNPPFIGDKKMIGLLGEPYVERLRQAYAGRVPGGADFVMYWFDKALRRIDAGTQQRAGFVATQSIRRGASSEGLKRIVEVGRIFDAWDDEEWTVDGAAVRVSLVCFDKRTDGVNRIDGKEVPEVYADLSSGSSDLTQAKPLASNACAFIGDQKSGDFDISGETARAWLKLPLNPNGKANALVLMTSARICQSTSSFLPHAVNALQWPQRRVYSFDPKPLRATS